MDSKTRTFVKAVVWMALGFLTMGLVGLAVTGSVLAGAGMAILNSLIGLLCYVIYERIWARIKWGRSNPSMALREDAHWVESQNSASRRRPRVWPSSAVTAVSGARTARQDGSDWR